MENESNNNLTTVAIAAVGTIATAAAGLIARRVLRNIRSNREAVVVLVDEGEALTLVSDKSPANEEN